MQIRSVATFAVRRGPLCMPVSFVAGKREGAGGLRQTVLDYWRRSDCLPATQVLAFNGRPSYPELRPGTKTPQLRMSNDFQDRSPGVKRHRSPGVDLCRTRECSS